MTTPLCHPAVLAIGGEKRVRELTPAHVESRLGPYACQETIDRVLVTPEYRAFERRIRDKGWPSPADPLALMNVEGEWGVISGLFTYIATKRLQRDKLPVVFLKPHEVPDWQKAVQVPRGHEPVSEDEELELMVRSFYG